MINKDEMTKIEYKIHKLRIVMVATAEEKGFNHSDTIKCSQELDTFISKYQKLKENEKAPQ
ncbi:aspartyl-phosphate phosphatase Spo0E family protein [Texcoconibacillus texcoconensis]|uniref:Aspartyl-phosphate phosphatase Spo0E family protein n=1 Tax=Texcoconibacillus texcoconensis TaxID=1095777 RepID=A0A840QMC6_9BACI|nr:aspartyl-phosphate phosphatase Spo0E family protein [Texcoconibacillus texcoconensis]MBB5172529.1 hypothetical protein [Texcoconibacillus texcoconensis]